MVDSEPRGLVNMAASALHCTLEHSTVPCSTPPCMDVITTAQSIPNDVKLQENAHKLINVRKQLWTSAVRKQVYYIYFEAYPYF